MSQVATVFANSVPLTVALAGVLAGWTVLIIFAGLVSTLSRDRSRRDAAFRVLDRLLACLPERTIHGGDRDG